MTPSCGGLRLRLRGNPDATVAGRVSQERARELLANPPVNQYGRRYPPSKVFKHEVYEEIMGNSGVFVLQKMNMRIPDWVAFRNACEKENFQAKVVQTKIFRALLKDLAQRGHPEAEDLVPFLVGSVATVSANPDTEKVGETLVKLLKVVNGQQKVLLLGGRIEGAVYSTDEILRISKLPPLADLRGELVAVMEQPVRRLLQLLGGQQQQLVGLLEQHRQSTGFQLGKILEMQEEKLKNEA